MIRADPLFAVIARREATKQSSFASVERWIASPLETLRVSQGSQ
jgi:hypothetical protein